MPKKSKKNKKSDEAKAEVEEVKKEDKKKEDKKKPKKVEVLDSQDIETYQDLLKVMEDRNEVSYLKKVRKAVNQEGSGPKEVRAFDAYLASMTHKHEKALRKLQASK